jgi:hypothetical protein
VAGGKVGSDLGRQLGALERRAEGRFEQQGVGRTYQIAEPVGQARALGAMGALAPLRRREGPPTPDRGPDRVAVADL